MFLLTAIWLQSSKRSTHSSFHWDMSQRDEDHLCRLLLQEDPRRRAFWMLFVFSLAILNYSISTFCNFEDQSVQRLIRAIGEFIIKRFISHVLAEHSCVSSQPRNRHADKVIDFEHFILVASEF